MKARLTLALALCTILCACAGPSLRYKNEIDRLFERGKFEVAADRIEANRSKMYGERDEMLFHLDTASAVHAAHMNERSNSSLAAAQDKMEDLEVRSIAGGIGTLLINDYTQPYRARVFERAFSHFMRGMDLLALGEDNGAVVEARRAVFFLDYTRERQSGYNDDAFVQFFASMMFEDRGQLSSARIARNNALNAYENQRGFSSARAPDFQPPPPRERRGKGELIVFHLNGRAPLIISQEIMLAWNDVWFTVQGNNDLQGVPQSTINAVFAGAFGRSVTVSFPQLVASNYLITTSAVNGVATQLVSDIGAALRQTLNEERTAAFARTVTRAVTKYILSVQSRHFAQKATGDETVGQLVGIFMSALSNVTEKADTRSWFTLPAEVRMASLWLPAGQHDIRLVSYDNTGRAVDERLFENVQINEGGRTYLYHRTAR